MLRKLITLYRVVFLIWCSLILVGTLLGGLAVVIEGSTPEERRTGVGLILGGAFLSVVLAGSFALALENNESLRKIAEKLSEGDRRA
ncbi:hypothetical protein [Rhodobacter maris]|uniref:Uncharacterized protein n=1 Tax=Rhodobacter maris TaxID=446682 RepID=A0A285THZ8_9RHOB|nr:hypothetical protein [Rhodobacter maris]SOC21368.1 hypothetical protein SAMN05877831_1233 [Rhodobacter maris]